MDRGGDLANRVRRKVPEEVHGGKEFVSARFIPGSFFSSHRRHAVLLGYLLDYSLLGGSTNPQSEGDQTCSLMVSHWLRSPVC